MSTPDDSSTIDELAGRIGLDEESEEVPGPVLAALAVGVAFLVALGTFSALDAGVPAIGIGFGLAASLFLGPLVVYEAGRRAADLADG